MSHCSLNWSANDALSALDEGDLEHVKSCEACSEVVAIRARAKAAWSASLQLDDTEERLSSELRLAHAWPKPRPTPIRRTAAVAALGAAAAVALVLGARSEPVLVAQAPAHARVAVAAPAKREEPRTLVATSPCETCRVGAARKPRVEAGTAIATDEPIEVPAGARLMLGFAFESGLVDPKEGADIEGPAAVSYQNDELALDRGTAHLRDADVVVVTPTTRVVTKRATYTIRVDDRGAAHVAVEAGTVTVDLPGATAPVTIAPGKSLSIAPKEPETGKPVETATAPSETAPAPSETATKAEAPKPTPTANQEDQLRDARALFRSGDAEAARPKLEELASSSDARIARRAQFTLAELELGSGKKDAARGRLDALLTAPDASLAADAAMLLARSHPGPSDRAAVWARYLATQPASPYRERALLERAEALLDAHRAAEAAALLDEVRRLPDLPIAQKRQLDRLTFKAREVR